MNLPRRALLAGIALAGLAPLLLGRKDPQADFALLTGFADLGDAAAIGRAYLAQQNPAEAASDLSADLMARQGIPSGAASSRTAIAHAIARQCRREFAAGDVVSVHGWQLARTEAELCALAALAAAASPTAAQPI